MLFLRCYVHVLKPERVELSSNFSDVRGAQGKMPLGNCGIKTLHSAGIHGLLSLKALSSLNFMPIPGSVSCFWKTL